MAVWQLECESPVRVLLFLLVLVTTVSAEVIGRDQLQANFRLEIERGQAYLVGEFSNRSSRPLPFFLPAGARLNCEVEPCLPIVVGRDLQVTIPPRGTQRVRVEALSLYAFPHTPGLYNFAHPLDEERQLCKLVQAVWRRQRASQLRGGPLKVAQAVVFLSNGADPKGLAQSFQAEELQEARAILQAGR